MASKRFDFNVLNAAPGGWQVFSHAAVIAFGSME
jgi:hypothetical protein